MSPDARRSGAPSEPPKSPSVQQVGIEEGFLSVKCFFKSRSLAGATVASSESSVKADNQKSPTMQV
jgi:hypothetical protein